ncbi:hypothetical protein [Streptomyces platensis]|uniref:hypothetical protein n=1 Tax=Streptomyces platensis TaxID=58346 RepID=UPI001F2DD215|nr:hypothetical protein [Streptomyces platensis]MCF3145521.1 hypothetical protein [Streptomyces platensis]WSW55620.1 hypothetical protein OG962_31895 [Streptomyces platensis]
MSCPPPCPPPVDARKALDFLRTSGLVDLTVPLQRVVDQVSQLDEVAGYVLAWERYVLVVANQVAEDDSAAGS